MAELAVLGVQRWVVVTMCVANASNITSGLSPMS